jgi:hypothetical protein
MAIAAIRHLPNVATLALVLGACSVQLPAGAPTQLGASMTTVATAPASSVDPPASDVAASASAGAMPSPAPSVTPQPTMIASALPSTPVAAPQEDSSQAGNSVNGTEQSLTATARCQDGTLSYSAHRSGTCSHHGGVAVWL